MNIRSVKAIKVMPIVGVRPQIIKSAPVLHLLDKDEELTLQLIHSGQHYDFEMSKVFFNEFDLPDPLHNLGIGSVHMKERFHSGKLVIKPSRLVSTLPFSSPGSREKMLNIR